MGDHHHREAKRLFQIKDQLIESLGGQGVKACRRLVQKQQIRIKRQRPG